MAPSQVLKDAGVNGKPYEQDQEPENTIRLSSQGSSAPHIRLVTQESSLGLAAVAARMAAEKILAADTCHIRLIKDGLSFALV